MPEVHLPHLDDDEEEVQGSPAMDDHAEESPAPAPSPRQFKLPRLPKLLLEVILISSGVFLGLSGEQWRESHHKRELAQIALRDLRRELEINREQVAAKKDYHASNLKVIGEFLKADAEQRKKIHLNIQGVQVLFFEHAAWDLAIANGSLAYIDPELASSVAHVYSLQQECGQLTQGLTQALYVRPPTLPANYDSTLGAVDIYYSDIVPYDARLTSMYADLIPKIDRELEH